MSPIADERLRLIFTCCHPALAPEARVALTLRAARRAHHGRGGARVPRLREPRWPSGSCAPRRRSAPPRIPYEVPRDADLPARLGSVLATLYLIFTEGYAATAGDALVRRELCAEAIRLGRRACALMPDEPEAIGLLALMLLHDSRRRRAGRRGGAAGAARPTRTARRGTREAIAEGLALVERALALRGARPLRRCRPRSPPSTPARGGRRTPTGTAIARAYDDCSSRSTTARWWRSTARSRWRWRAAPEAGLALADEQAEALDGYHLLHATRADLLRRLGRADEAAAAYERAIALAANPVEREFLARRLRRGARAAARERREARRRRCPRARRCLRGAVRPSSAASARSRAGGSSARSTHPALLAEEDGRLLGVLTYVPGGRSGGADPPRRRARARRRDGADRGGRLGRGCRRRAALADHDQRQRRRAALLPAPRLPARRAPPRRGRRVAGATEAGDPETATTGSRCATSSSSSCRSAHGGDGLGGDRARHALLGHQRPHELGGRDVERRVAARRARDGEQRPAGRCGPPRRRAPRSRSRRRSRAGGRPRTTARRRRTGCGTRGRRARGRRSRPCSPRRRWRPRGRSPSRRRAPRRAGSGRRPRCRRAAGGRARAAGTPRPSSRAPWSSGRASQASTVTGRRSASSAITPRPVPRPEAASAPLLQCVRTDDRARRAARASSASAPWRASAALAASSSRWIASAASRAASASRSGGAASAAAATRSTAQARLRAVGRAPASSAAARSRAARLGSAATAIASP